MNPNPEATALRLILSYADGGNPDSLTAALEEFAGRCPGCTADVILELLQLLVDPINCSRHRDVWADMLQRRLAALLDELAEP
jgi:hypothetical protein